MNTLKYDKLPGIPRIWSDYASGLLPERFLPPAPQDLSVLRTRPADARNQRFRFQSLSQFSGNRSAPDSGRTLESLGKLRRQGSVAVVAAIRESLFGGPAVQILKCLAAVKACRELGTNGIAAVPVCWVSSAPASDPSRWTLNLLDYQGEVCTLRLQPEETAPSNQAPPSRQIFDLLAKIEEIGLGMFDAGIMEMLRTAYNSSNLRAATAHLFSALMEDLGMIVVDPQSPECKPLIEEAQTVPGVRAERIGILLEEQNALLNQAGYPDPAPETVCPEIVLQGCIFPAFASVVGPLDFRDFLRVLPVFDEMGVSRPAAWPYPGVTVMDSRSRRTLARYHIEIEELFSGESGIMEKARHSTPHSAHERLRELAVEADRRLSGLPIPQGDKVTRTRDSCREKIVYQIEKLGKRYESAGERRQQAAVRQTRKARNFLAPEGCTQEQGLAGIQFLLRYSMPVLQLLYDKLDILKFEHQLIPMD